MKLIWTNQGSSLAIGLYCASKEEGERFFNCCYNYGAVTPDARFHILKDDSAGCFGYFRSTWKDLKKMKNVPLVARLLPKNQKQIDALREDFLK